MKKTKMLVVLLGIALISLGLVNVVSASSASFTVTYDGNGADSGSVFDPNVSYVANDAVTVMDNGFIRDGYTFTGWKAEEVRKLITGFVSPVVYDDLEDGFLELFEVTVELRAANNLDLTKPADYQTIVKISNSATGQFTFTNVAIGEYTLFVYRPGFLLRSMRVTIDQSTTHLQPSDSGVFELIPGDYNCDGVVDASDINYLAALMNGNIVFGDSDYTASADLNADGKVDELDKDIIQANLNITVFDYAGSDSNDLDFLLNNGIDFILTKNNVAPNHSIDGNLYAEGDIFDMPAAHVILYAQWEKNVDVPATADTNNIWWWIAVMCVCLPGMACLLWNRRRMETE